MITGLVFGASGALLVTVLTGLYLRRLLGATVSALVVSG